MARGSHLFLSPADTGTVACFAGSDPNQKTVFGLMLPGEWGTGWTPVEPSGGPGDALQASVGLLPDGAAGIRAHFDAPEPRSIAGLHQARLGPWTLPLVDREGRPHSYRFFLGLLLLALADSLAGGVGVVVFLLATSSLVPELCRPEVARTLAARPVRRSTLVLGRWLAGVLFAAGHATLLAVLVNLAILPTLTLEPRLFVAVGVGVALFAVLSAIAALGGLVFRSPGLGALCALTVWFSAAAARTEPLDFAFQAAPLESAFEALTRTLPRTGELTRLDERLLVAPHLAPAARRLRAGRDRPIDWRGLVIPSAAWLLGSLGLACGHFGRREL
jgi:hypothetical protein